MEAEPSVDGSVPPALTEKLDSHRLVMRGTQAYRPRCVALEGVVGETSRCGIYSQRPSVCHELLPAWEFGQPSPQCDRARIAHGLAPLTPEDWVETASV
jgi:Fe-S-cluster containining protein